MPMSPHAVNNFVSDLVLMAQAMEKLPQVEAELKQVQSNATMLQGVIDDQGKDLEQSRAYAASLEQKVHAAEVARDDAELRFLELEEHATVVTRNLRTMQTALGIAINELDPPTPEPVSTIQPATEGPDQGSMYELVREQDMGHGSSEPVYHPVDIVSEPAPSWAGETVTPPSPGQSEADPTASEVTTGTPVTSVDQPAPAGVGKYSNMLYSNCPYYVSEVGWIAGGGTEYSYRH